eukprot:GHVU01194297.1.p1 GENE.GHVU01194297.1~~GHVU01194297.1.p1  ORF type:complete len:123 (+),score=16.51 GHVU01194297.1:354-722(+)
MRQISDALLKLRKVDDSDLKLDIGKDPVIRIPFLLHRFKEQAEPIRFAVPAHSALRVYQQPARIKGRERKRDRGTRTTTGSEKGTPSSMTSTPDSCICSKALTTLLVLLTTPLLYFYVGEII